ncbi:MAG: hypothetical protein D3922_14130, partial [Candidatus Electrothrix sp. AR1]|nr:hypothetical protein [Candidatus Electrothrix sp. AR1]
MKRGEIVEIRAPGPMSEHRTAPAVHDGTLPIYPFKDRINNSIQPFNQIEGKKKQRVLYLSAPFFLRVEVQPAFL